MTTIADYAQSKQNNFHFLRFIAATLVVVSHTYAFYGIDFEPYTWLVGYNTFGGLAVNTFFVISGFLILKSWQDEPHLVLFFWKRFLRIVPGLLGALLFSVFILGPLVTTLSMREYFKNRDTWFYLENVWLFPIYYRLPGVFMDLPYKEVVNASLWSLSVEWVAYVLTAIIGFIGVFKWRSFVLVLLGTLLTLEFHLFSRPEYTNYVFLTMLAGVKVRCLIYFFMGSLIYLYREKVPVNATLALACFGLYLLSFRTVYNPFICYITLPYLIFFLAYTPIAYIKNFGHYGDYSYGIYVYASPVQQLVMYYFGFSLSMMAYFCLSYCIVLVFAYFSWHYIEAPALKQKKLLCTQPTLS